MSGALYGIDIDGLEEQMEKKKIGGTAIGNKRIYAMKYADDVALVAESGGELKSMLNELRKYTKENKIEVNADKTKIIICWNGGRKKKEKKWTYEGEEIEEVKEVKYLGYWFTMKNSAAKQRKEMARKAQKATNAVWGIIKRSKRNSIRERMYLMNTVAKSVAMYGVEVWGWEKSEEIRRVHRRLCKMALGVSRDTQGYIWRE
ncbi:uncharacterized protein LOC123269748 [Cotesia glomerata]|uniref:uncharacterized protein LOC123269748 n=1 Tax=Cotesia glomerata TaxID=32391 RepID=UPI001D00757E|nr:uncharacterized protein LOC123269748 [Cotesia glomerata]